MKVNNVSLAAVGVKMSQYPDDRKPEIAFAGKSNVGKSTLINSMIGRKALARTSSQPGKTRTINFYNVEDVVYFVDLPGYGYAKAPKTEIERWGKMIDEYLNKRESLMGIVMLIDIRHEPGENDKMMYNWLKHYGYDIIIAATKMDKIKRSQIQKQLSCIKKAFNMDSEGKLIPFSGETKSGVEELWSAIEDAVGYKEEQKGE
ncbi:MAG: ribosome biogenesis GTP-binding protein YihA/YsxC [Candidatus Metalachnospira sp.]|nr:ribosome biogenesis GTP-binding protein YihA/YsxC [Candidatus Metalachnospira sp.]